MPAKTKKTTLRKILKDCSLIVCGGGEQVCWKGDLSIPKNEDDWKFVVTETELELIEVMYDRLQYSFNLDQEISFKGDSVSLDPVDGEQACLEPVTLWFFSVNNLSK